MANAAEETPEPSDIEQLEAELESKAELFAFLEKAQQAVETVNEAISRLQELGLHEKLTGIIDGTKTIIDDLTKEKKLTPEEAQKLRDALDKAQEIIDGAQTLTDQVQAILEKADEVLSGLNEEYRNAEALLEQMKQKLRRSSTSRRLRVRHSLTRQRLR